MNNINVFISVGATSNEIQETFVSQIERRLRSENLIPNTVGRNKFSADSPLKTVIDLMDECSGTIIVALERTYFTGGVENRNSNKEKLLSEVKYATSWNQIEASMAYCKGQPILVILEEGIKSEGLLEKGYDWYVMSVKPEIASLSTVEFNGVLSSWKKKVEDFEKRRTEKQIEEKKIDTASLTIGDLFKGLKPSHLWAILIAIVGLISGSFALGGRFFVGFSDDTNGKKRNEITNSTEEKIKIEESEIFQTDIAVHNETDKLNLSLWKQIPEELIDKEKFTPEIRDVTYIFEKLNTTKKYFVRTIYTSGLTPDVTCLDCSPNEKVVFRHEPYTPDPGRENMKKYNLYYDVSGVPIRQLTQRTFRIITWNSFRNPEGDWAGTLITYPTDNLNIQITFPLTKKFKDLRFGTRPRGANSDAPIANPSFSVNQDSTMVDFSFKNPEIQKSYRIRWYW